MTAMTAGAMPDDEAGRDAHPAVPPPATVTAIRAPEFGAARRALRSALRSAADALGEEPRNGGPGGDGPGGGGGDAPPGDRRARADETTKDLPGMLLTTRRAPVYALPIAKSGCTWVKNLLWQIDNPAPHPDPLDIHRTQDRDLVSAAGRSVAEIAASDYGFALVRAPADRLLSLYYDKVCSKRAFPWLCERLAARGAPVLEAGEDPDLHGQALDALIEEVAASVARRPGALLLNPHWRPQSARLRRAGPLRLLRVPAPLAEPLLGRLLAPAIPDIVAIMERIPVRNAAPRPAPREALLTPARRAAIDAIYPRDVELYDHALRRAETLV